MEHAPKQKTPEDEKKMDEMIRSIFDGYVATMDCPAAALVPEIMRAYPDALVVATTRDQKSWWRSMEHMNGLMSNWYMPLVVMWLNKTQGYGEWGAKFQQLSKWRYGAEGIREPTKTIHEDILKEVVPAEKILWYHVKEGWEPLCKFLNLPIPNQPFPHNNSKSDAEKSWYRHMICGGSSWIFALGVAFWALYYVSIFLEENEAAAPEASVTA